MTTKTIRVNLDGKKMTAAVGTRISELLGRASSNGDLPILGAIANRRLTGLYRTLTADAVVQTLNYNCKHGAFIYRRSACLLLLAVAKELYPKAQVEIGQSLGDGYFFELNGVRTTRQTAQKIERHMNRYVERDLPFVVSRVFVDEAVDHFRAEGSLSKVRFLTQTPRSDVRTVSLSGFTDILHGPVCLSTGVLKNFRIFPYAHGFLLAFPDRQGQPPKPVCESDHALLFETVIETRDWNEVIGVASLSDLNDACIQGTVSDLIKVAESLHEKKIGRIADMITHRTPLPRLIMVAGPSASGKTTFSQRLGVQLRVNGLRPRTISMDNYYVDRKKTPRHSDGSYDFESVYALDLDLFNDHLKKIIAQKEVQSPVYDFKTGKRSRKTIPILLRDRDVLVLEGIHALNPLLHKSIPKADKFGVFVSALTQLSIDEHNRIFTSDSRLIRRIVRDRTYRGYTATDTLNMWLSVRDGEDKYIFPFQNIADVMFNSALVYEHALLKPLAKRFLMEVPSDVEAYTEAVRLYKFLEDFIPIFQNEVPPTSVLREFIGGSTFQY